MPIYCVVGVTVNDVTDVVTFAALAVWINIVSEATNKNMTRTILLIEFNRIFPLSGVSPGLTPIKTLDWLSLKSKSCCSPFWCSLNLFNAAVSNISYSKIIKKTAGYRFAFHLFFLACSAFAAELCDCWDY